MAIKASEIVDKESLRNWLKDQSDDVARVIASRAALRIFPFALSIHQVNHPKLTAVIKFDLTLQVFRASFISWVARKYPTHDITAAAAFAAAAANSTAAFAAAAFAAANAANAANAAAAFAAAAFAAANAANAAANSTAAAFAARAAFTAANAFAAARADAEWLENNPDDINALIKQPLWLEPSEVPEAYRKLQNTINDRFDTFSQSDLAQDTSFGLIGDWYAALLPEKGKPRSLFGEKKDLELATQPDEFWEGEAQEVMDRVAELVGWPEDYRKQEEPLTEENAPEIPPIKPAAIMPEWRDGKLSLPREPIKNDFTAGDMDQAISALKKELQTFSNDIRKSNSVDPRIIDYISQLAEEAPETVPPQEEFFRFAHNEKVLQGIINRSSDEWDVLIASKFDGLVEFFSKTIQKIPLWREFVREQNSDIQSQEDLEKVKELEAMLAENLQDELAQEFIDPQLPQALTALTNDIPDVNPVTDEDRALPASVQLQGYDVLESMNNILKALITPLVALSDTSAKVGGASADVIRKAAGIVKDQIPISGEKMLRDVTDQVMMIPAKALKHTLKMGKWGAYLSALSGGGYAMFSWLQPILNLLGL